MYLWSSRYEKQCGKNYGKKEIYPLRIITCVYRFVYKSFISRKLRKFDMLGPISKNHIDEYYKKFKKTYYMPNAILANEYLDAILYLSNNNDSFLLLYI